MPISSRRRKNDWSGASHRFEWIQISDDERYLRDGSLSLKKFWYRYGGRWTKLKRLIREHRGDCCQKCGAEGVTLEAHEVWDHVSASSAGIEPKLIRQLMKVHRAQLRGEGKRPRALVRALVDVRLLCEDCHGPEHAWMGRHHRDFIIETRYAGLCELPDFGSYAEWESAMKDEAEQY